MPTLKTKMLVPFTFMTSLFTCLRPVCVLCSVAIFKFLGIWVLKDVTEEYSHLHCNAV